MNGPNRNLAPVTVFVAALLLAGLTACRDSHPGTSPEKDSLAAHSDTASRDPDFRAGAQHLRAGAFAQASAAFERARTTSPELADWATYYAALAVANAGDTVATDAHLQKLDETFRREWAWRARVLALEKAGALARGSAVADSIAAGLNGPVRRSEALVRSAQLNLARQDTARARSAASIALRIADASPTGVAAADIVARTATSAEDLLAAAHAYLSSGNYSKALPVLTRVRNLVKTPDAQRRVTFLIGQALFARRDYNGAVRALAPLTARGDSLAAEALLLSARAELRARQPAGTRALLAKLVQSKARSGTKAAAHFLLADMADDAGDAVTATREYQATIAAAPRNEYAVNAFMRMGTRALAARDADGAIVVFGRFASAHAQTAHAQQAYFWLAQAHDRARHTAEARTFMSKARTLDPYSYYGLLAGEWLKQPPGTGAAGPAAVSALQARAERAAYRVHTLRDVDLADASAFELYRVTDDLNAQAGGAYALAEALIAQNEAAAAIRIGIRTFRREGAWNRRLLHIVYPLPFESLIKREANAARVDPFLVAGLIRQESTFDPAARSRVGAIGLMQMMPATAAAIARRSSESAAELLRDPAVNIHLGVTHLRGLIEQYRGQPAYLLAAYNAGQTPVARWLKLPGASDPLLFAERIPYAETREYVQIVQRNVHMYRLLYDGSR